MEQEKITFHIDHNPDDWEVEVKDGCYTLTRKKAPVDDVKLDYDPKLTEKQIEWLFQMGYLSAVNSSKLINQIKKPSPSKEQVEEKKEIRFSEIEEGIKAGIVSFCTQSGHLIDLMEFATDKISASEFSKRVQPKS